MGKITFMGAGSTVFAKNVIGDSMMSEALRDFEEGKCGHAENCFISVDKMNNYKFMSAKRSFYPHFKDYNISIWKNLIEVFALRISYKTSCRFSIFTLSKPLEICFSNSRSSLLFSFFI